MSLVQVEDFTDDGSLMTEGHLADSVWTRLKRPAGAEALAPGEGLLIVRCQSIHSHLVAACVWRWSPWTTPGKSRGYAEVCLFVDTRIKLCPEKQWMDYLALNYGRYDWGSILDNYGIDTLLLQIEKQQHLFEGASAAAEWERVYEDDQAVISQRVEES